MSAKKAQDEELVTLAYFAVSPPAEMIRELLANHGIAAILQGANYGALEPLPGAGGFSEIRLLVRRRDFSRALALYAAFFVRDRAALKAGADVED